MLIFMRTSERDDVAGPLGVMPPRLRCNWPAKARFPCQRAVPPPPPCHLLGVGTGPGSHVRTWTVRRTEERTTLYHLLLRNDPLATASRKMLIHCRFFQEKLTPALKVADMMRFNLQHPDHPIRLVLIAQGFISFSFLPSTRRWRRWRWMRQGRRRPWTTVGTPCP
jgi:hypothetical protein